MVVRRAVRRPVLVALVVAALHVTGMSPAGACSCAPIGDEGAFADADAVFVGSSVSRTVEHGEVRSTADPAVHRFEVSAVYKGEVRRDQEVVTASDGSSCGFEAPLDVEVLVFADRTSSYGPRPGAGQLTGDLCNGTRALEVRPVPAAFGEPVEPAQAGAVTAADIGTDDGDGASPRLPIAAGAAVVVLAFVVLRRRARPPGGRSRSSAG